MKEKTGGVKHALIYHYHHMLKCCGAPRFTSRNGKKKEVKKIPIENRPRATITKKALLRNVMQSARRISIPKDYFTRYPEAILTIDYAMTRFVKSGLGFKIMQNDPKVYFTAKRIPEKKQIVIHLRMPVQDKWNDINEFLDIDIYFPEAELKKINQLVTEGNLAQD